MDLVERQRLVEAGEASLAAGDVDAATRAFERAAGMVHSQDVELAIVRAQMQAGLYQQALGFAAHAAGAHPRLPAGTALYVWLLQIGGQGNAARRYLQEGLQRHPDDRTLLAARGLLAAPYPSPEADLLAAPLRAAPYSHGALVEPGAVFAGTACLLADQAQSPQSPQPGPTGQPGQSRFARVPASTVEGASRIWLRNGLGQTTLATPEQDGPDAPTVRLRLANPFPLPANLQGQASGERPPFAGSPAFTVEYAAGAGLPDAPAWPMLRQGFFGHLEPASPLRRLTIDLPVGPRGGPVFDAHGRLLGLTLSPAPSQVAMLSSDQVERDERMPVAMASTARPARAAVDQIYEAGLRLALQVAVLR